MNAVFLKLLNMSAAGSVLILAVILLRALLRRAPRWTFCVMWALVAVRLVCPVSIASPLSVFQAAPALVSESGEVEVFRSAGGSEKPMIAADTVQIERPRANAETIWEIPGSSYAVTQRSRDAYLPPLVQAYLLGVTVMLLYALVSTLLLRRRVAASVKLEGKVRVCDSFRTPFILGLFRPRIYLPSALSEEEKRLVLAHERAHLRRLDHIWKPLGFLILSVHWFNPLCWLAFILLCRDIELACDEKVIRELGRSERAAYLQTLLNCSARRILAACPVAFGETGVKMRVEAVLNYKKPAFWILLAAVLGCLVLIVCFAAKPMPGEPDLSFLNYKNAIPLIGQNDTAPYANLYPADSDGVQPGVADAKALVRFLESAEWTQRRAPSPSPEPRGFIEFMIEDDYRIILYQSGRLAAVRFGNDVRYYRTAAGDYEAALEAFIPAPSTAPDRLPDERAASERLFSDPARS
ncbi:MAG: M56 family metallopeptidase [Oscillospiraceae bacterium]|nr:M56 family metallopeptidase [Oscillospiraceae bacterium]